MARCGASQITHSEKAGASDWLPCRLAGWLVGCCSSLYIRLRHCKDERIHKNTHFHSSSGRSWCEAMGNERARVGAIFIYPVKSCRGIAVQRAVIGARGFRWDREWMLVDANGRFLSQRVDPSLSLVATALPPEALDEDNTGKPIPPGAALHLTAPGMEPLQVPLEPSLPRETVERVAVWKWGGPALDEGPVPAEWFSRYLNKPVRMVRFAAEGEVWPTDPVYAPGFQISFTDGFPFMLATSASLKAVNERLKEPLPINRFRPNLLVDGDQVEAFEEDSWHTFRVGGHTFHGVKPRARCKITTVNQVTAEVGEEPLKTLRTFRLGQHLNPSRPDMKIWAYFAMNCVCEESLKPESRASVRLGDPVDVVEKVAEFGFKIVAA